MWIVSVYSIIRFLNPFFFFFFFLKWWGMGVEGGRGRSRVNPAACFSDLLPARCREADLSQFVCHTCFRSFCTFLCKVRDIWRMGHLFAHKKLCFRAHVEACLIHSLSLSLSLSLIVRLFLSWGKRIGWLGATAPPPPPSLSLTHTHTNTLPVSVPVFLYPSLRPFSLVGRLGHGLKPSSSK